MRWFNIWNYLYILAQDVSTSGREDEREPIDALEIFEVRQPQTSLLFIIAGVPSQLISAKVPLVRLQHIRDVTDPEHPYTLEQLNVVSESLIDVDDPGNSVRWAEQAVIHTKTSQHTVEFLVFCWAFSLFEERHCENGNRLRCLDLILSV